VGLFDKVFPAMVVIPLLVLIPAFGEEIAWRGYAVTRLLPTMTPLRAALLLGVPWAVIHLFLQLPGQMNAGLEWWPTLISLLSYSVILTWAFVGSGGSVLLTALIHAGLNGVAPLMGCSRMNRSNLCRASCNWRRTEASGHPSRRAISAVGMSSNSNSTNTSRWRALKVASAPSTSSTERDQLISPSTAGSAMARRHQRSGRAKKPRRRTRAAWLIQSL